MIFSRYLDVQAYRKFFLPLNFRRVPARVSKSRPVSPDRAFVQQASDRPAAPCGQDDRLLCRQLEAGCPPNELSGQKSLMAIHSEQKQQDEERGKSEASPPFWSVYGEMVGTALCAFACPTRQAPLAAQPSVASCSMSRPDRSSLYISPYSRAISRMMNFAGTS